jgi:CMP-N,N'-diacetyllegionaminic acid synthase
MKILAIIPARKGSKGLKNKNFLKFNGYPLFLWSYWAAKKSKYKISNIILSTDSKIIAKIAKKNSIEVPFLRPKIYSSDKASSYLMIKHCLDFFKKKKIIFDFFILLEPTSPLRDFKDIDSAIKVFIKKKLRSLVSVTKAECQHPNFLYKKNKRNFLTSFFHNSKKDIRRQLITPVFYPDGNIYLSCTKTFLKFKSFYHKYTYGFEMPKWKSIEIDDKFDFKIAEYIMKIKNIFN